MIHIYHLDWEKAYSADESCLPGFSVPSPETYWERGLYKKVAEVNTDCLDDAFRLTNSINAFWGVNPEVSLETDFINGCRSSSVGDLFEKDGVFHVVENFGFRALEIEQTSASQSKKIRP